MNPEPVLDLYRAVEPERECSYLPLETAALEYRIAQELSGEQFAQLLRRGWRRFGNYLFRPQCPACRKCRSLRVVVNQFRPSKSERRTIRRNDDVEVLVMEPQVTDRHVELYNAWHEDMTQRRGWVPSVTTPEDYANTFIGWGYDFAREFQYRRDGRLIGVGLVDETPAGLSSIYFYHDPAWRSLGPGTFSALCELHYARQLNLPHLYMGYWISECPSVAYKSRFEPHEILREYVDEDVEPVWLKPDGSVSITESS